MLVVLYVLQYAVEVLVLLAGTTSVFWGMHLSGAMGLPRRMPDAPDTYMHEPVQHHELATHHRMGEC